MLGDVIDHFAAVLVVESLVNRRGLQRGRYIGPRIDERLVPKFRNFKNLKFRAERFLEPDNHFLFDEIDNADKMLFAAERKLERNGVGTEALANCADDVVKIRAGSVHLVDETDARHAVLVRLTPNRFR